jgi:hypothetical protein
MQGYQAQKTFGAFREQYSRMQLAVLTAIENGAATPDEYQGTLMQVLRAVENLRLKHEDDVNKLKQQIEMHNGGITACSMMSDMIIRIVEGRVTERLKIIENMKVLALKDIEENKARVEELREKGLHKEADDLLVAVRKDELELQLQNAIPTGSEQELQITRKAMKDAEAAVAEQADQSMPPELTTKPTRMQVSNAEKMDVQKAVAASLKEEPVMVGEDTATRTEGDTDNTDEDAESGPWTLSFGKNKKRTGKKK